jgi:hypothetical protein
VENNNFDNDSNKNNSRKSQVEHNDSRDDDFGGIEMKQIARNIEGKQDNNEGKG